MKASGINGWLYLFWQPKAVVSLESQPKSSELGVDLSCFSNVFVNSHFFLFFFLIPHVVLIIFLSAGNITLDLLCFGIICEKISHQLIAIV